jgi:uncharacterized tellurite resistance protein B-like protein
MTVHAVRHRIGLLTDLFLGAAFADGHFVDRERDYIRSLLKDLLVVDPLPAGLEQHIAEFDPGHFDLSRAAADFHAEPPMSRRRLLELIAYVTLADGALVDAEDAFIRRLGAALDLAEVDYRDLTLDPEGEQHRRSFIELARVPLPLPDDLRY